MSYKSSILEESPMTLNDLKKMPIVTVVATIVDEYGKEYLLVGIKRSTTLEFPEFVDNMPVIVHIIKDIHIQGHIEVIIN